jgi:AcrR family transcriptional regulator
MTSSDPSADESHRPRTNAELREEAMGRMVQTTISMIAERGASRLSLVDVGRDAGYSHSLPNYYFKSKTRLLTEVYAFIVDRAKGRIRDWAKANTPERIRPGLQNVLATVRAYLGLIRIDATGSRAMHIVLSESISSMPELLQAVKPHNRQLLDFFEAELRTAIQRGEIDASIDVQSMALLIAALLRGTVAQYMVDPERVDLDQLAATLTLLLSRGTAVQRTGGTAQPPEQPT